MSAIRKKSVKNFTASAAHRLAIAVFNLCERGIIQDRTAASDALESYADCFFDVMDGSGYVKLRDSLAPAGAATPQPDAGYYDHLHGEPEPNPIFDAMMKVDAAERRAQQAGVGS